MYGESFFVQSFVFFSNRIALRSSLHEIWVGGLHRMNHSKESVEREKRKKHPTKFGHKEKKT